MDFRFCPSGGQYATDLMLRLVAASIDEVCTTSIVPWVIFMGLASLINIWVAIRRTQLHAKLRKNARTSTLRPRRFPFMVIASWLTVVSTVVFTFTPFAGSNAGNGGTGVQLDCVFLLFGVQSLLMLWKLIKLGKKIIPMSTKFVEDKTYADNSALLSRVDAVLTISFVLGAAILLAQFILLVILAFAMPSDIPIWLTVSFALYGTFIALLCFSISYQLHRCIRAVRASYDGSSAVLNQGHSQGLRRTVHKMQVQRRTLVCFGVPTVLFYSLSAAQVIPRHYAVIVVLVVSAAITNLLIFSAQTVKPRQSRAMHTSSAAGSLAAAVPPQMAPMTVAMVARPDAEIEVTSAEG